MTELFNSYPLLMIFTFLLILVFILSSVGLFTHRKRITSVSYWILMIAFALNTLIIIERWIEGGRPPFKTLFETMIFYPWCTIVVTLVLILIHRLYVLIPFTSAISIFGLIYALIKPDVEIINLPPALQSGWFVPHVVTYFISYAALFASFALALLYLIFPNGFKKLRYTKSFDTYAHQATVFGLVTLTMGLVMGSFWGQAAWGTYWGWDPKENWALISYLAYIIYFHLRLLPEWRGRRSMIILVVSFLTIIFTYLGMSFLPTAGDSLHVYQ